MSPTTAHVINHTHWDREWFVTSVYTSRWIPGLIDKLEKLAAANDTFRFLFDGQTLVIEDLLTIAPDYADKIRSMVSTGCLQIGPYYCQPDWKLTGGELLLRNLMYGQEDIGRFGGTMKTGWMVDTFGHISQSPQIHRLFGIDSVFVWRGVPELEPYFNWFGADGSQLLTINLFGGYRNLYGVSHAPEVALRRLKAEIDKLRSFYPTADIPLFDGYDLEDNPEDPLRFYAELGGLPSDIMLRESTPADFVETIRSRALDLPDMAGELNSGKFGATFPGVYSSRTYLKTMARDCEHMLFQLCEPLAVMAWMHGREFNAVQYEFWGRMLLQNAVHDCICGVSIDQVHEKMAVNYRQVFDGAADDARVSLATIMRGFAPGSYAVSTNPFAADEWQVAGDELVHVTTHGVGVWPVVERVPIATNQTPIESFSWRNAHYEAVVTEAGTVQVGEGVFGELVVSAENGDTYSDEIGATVGSLQRTSAIELIQSSDHHAVVAFDAALTVDDIEVNAAMQLLFDESPLLKWHIDLDSCGTNLRVEMMFKTALTGNIHAGMPFDTVQRPTVDDSLLPRQLPPELSAVVLGQRELNAVEMFPFHDYVAVSDEEATVAVLAKGLRGYRIAGDGDIVLPLRRSVAWLTAANLSNRVGDAGPFFYVPDARCERTVRHEVALCLGQTTVESIRFQALNAAYQNPPLIVSNRANGSRRSWQLLQENVPLSALTIRDGQALARFYNPLQSELTLNHAYMASDVWGSPLGEADQIRAKQIMTVQIESDVVPSRTIGDDSALFAAELPAWRVGINKGQPDRAILAELAVRVDEMGEQIALLEQESAETTGDDLLRLQHRIYALKRERLEFQLSLLLNQRKLEQAGTPSTAYLFELDPEIAELTLGLNQMRIKRRIFDYVVEALRDEV
ncbi:MAG: hypothetical protein M9930_21220 [Anaerolineae bacterium]|nr:hypothetical protein [Anaerolineae bacterium]